MWILQLFSLTELSFRITGYVLITLIPTRLYKYLLLNQKG